MTIYSRVNDALRLADTLASWDESAFEWSKASIAAAFAEAAYYEIPEHEIKDVDNVKLIPCEGFQQTIARMGSTTTSVSLRNQDLQIDAQVISKDRVIAIVARTKKAIFVAFRGTTLTFADFKADLDCRKLGFPSAYGTKLRVHRGFYDAVSSCFDEVIAAIQTETKTNSAPLYVTGHSLGGAMAAIFHARLEQFDHPFLEFRHRRRIRPSVSCYVFGMPRFGNADAVSLLPSPFSIINEFDAVPTLPPTFLGFNDCNDERCLNAAPALVRLKTKGNFGVRSIDGTATVLGVSDHRMETYSRRVTEMKDISLSPVGMRPR